MSKYSLIFDRSTDNLGTIIRVSKGQIRLGTIRNNLIGEAKWGYEDILNTFRLTNPNRVGLERKVRAHYKGETWPAKEQANV